MLCEHDGHSCGRISLRTAVRLCRDVLPTANHRRANALFILDVIAVEHRASLPASSSVVIHAVAPIPSKNRNSQKFMPFWPATGGASVASPGTNLAIISVTPRRRPNESWVRRTQMVGSIDSLQSRRST